MRKYVLIYFLLGSLAMAKDTNLDELLNFVSETSYRKEQYKIKKDLNKEREKIYKLDEYNGVETSGETNYDEYDKSYNVSGRVKFGDFYVEGERKKREDGNFKYGIEKSLKDLILSKNDNDFEKLQIEKKIEKKEFNKELEEQQLKLIELYKNYKDVELEKVIRENALKTLYKEKIILEKSYKLGAISKVDLDSLIYSYLNINLEVKDLKRELETLNSEFLYEFKINLNGLVLSKIDTKNIDYKKYLESVGENQLKIDKLQKSLIVKNIDYLTYDKKVPEISIGAERDTKYNDNRVFLKVSKNIFYKDMGLEVERANLKDKEIEISQKTREVLSERFKIKKNLYTLKKDYEIIKNNRELEESKYNIKKLENKMGKIGYIDVMESFDKYLDLKIQEKKLENSLNSYIYEIKVRGEK
ncbi:TolC family protein [uncultured Cetobacterium sp.]|uniref:TolC family protein n=1 Tax=uncultured Cetobacterium sp. TaxID=527638 RepID=UPI00261EF548|nr:TolC family protein [uncultured Cetobacterium sp.]